MAKKIEITYNDKVYTLEYTRDSISKMEKDGFVAGEVADKPMTRLPQLFAGAFIVHHPFIKKAVIDEIYDRMTNKHGLYNVLGEMFQECAETLMEDPEESEGNATWVVK